MTRRPSASIVANPVLVGAVTTLVIVVAVFLAYNANNGLPFVPTREMFVDIGNGAALVKGAEVREGGYRIGVLEVIRPVTLSSGQTVARLQLKLDKGAGDVPADTRINIRPRSSLGLKFVELVRGRSHRLLGDGDLIPVQQTNVPVQFDDIFKIFDAPTRQGMQANLTTFGSAFASRGQDVNELIARLRPLLEELIPVARTLSDADTQLPRFFRELGDAVRVVAPIAAVNARLFGYMATTFEAFSRDPDALRETIAKSPATLAVGTRSLRDERPFLRDLAAFAVDLRYAARDLRAALPTIDDALEVGTPVLRRMPELNAEVADTLSTVRDLAGTPTTNRALRAVADTVRILNPLVRFIGPYQTVCNNWNYFFTYLGEHISEPDATGTAQRANVNGVPTQDDGPGDEGASEPGNGEHYDPVRSGANDRAILHGQPYGAAIDDNGNADCENGQRGYPKGPIVEGIDPNDFEGTPFKVVASPHTPGNQGPTFAGRRHVPAGETFSREPEGAPRAKLNPILTTGIYSG